MNKAEKITLVSVFAEDIYYDAYGKLIKKQRGGPALFISKVFQKEKIIFNLQTAPPAKVEILIKKNGEFGRIAKKPKAARVDFIKIKTPFVVVSSLLDDFKFKNVKKFKGKIFFDIQGYVRDGRYFGKKKEWNIKNNLSGSIFCLKGTSEELKYIPLKTIKNQKNKILLITKGKKGCDAYIFGKRYNFKVKNAIQNRDTVGAGDTFFAYFISSFIKSNDTIASVEYAIERTTKFLKSKNRLDR